MNLRHRGACGCEANTGDGAGILHPDARPVPPQGRTPFALPRRRRVRRRAGVPAARAQRPRRASSSCSSDSSPRKASGCSAGATCRPTTREVGPSAVAVEPVIKQVFIGRDPRALARRRRARCAFERKLYVIRKRFERARRRAAVPIDATQCFYVVSLSCNTLIYKGMLTAEQIQPMFPDLRDPDMRVGARARAPALQHQHVPVLAARASVSLRRAQRRDQHAARQHQLDAGARRTAALGRCSATICRRCCRSSAKAAATRRRSTTCSSSSS